MEASAKQFRKRNAILECLRQTREHPGAETVYAMLRQEHPDISLATVYRNLALFKSQGLIMSVGTVKGVERFDGNPVPHAHFICTGCDAVIDLPGVDPPEGLCEAATRDVGGRVAECHLTFTGVCGQCMNAPPGGEPA